MYAALRTSSPCESAVRAEALTLEDMSIPMPNVLAARDFQEASELVLQYLQASLPLSFWSVTRVENGRQTYLYLDPENGYGLTTGGSHPWEASYCVHMAAGTTPAVALDAQSVPQYRDAEVNALVPIGAYAGAAILEPDGSVFGAICGLDPESRPQDTALGAAGPVLQLLGQLLSMALMQERLRADAERAVAAERAMGETDVLTGLLNRRAWERLLADEEERFRRLGDPTVIAVLDLDMLKTVNDTQGHAAGDAYIQRAGDALRAAIRKQDQVARLGGDEFGVFLPDCTEDEAAYTVARIYDALEEQGVAGSLGWAPLTVLSTLPDVLEKADAAMYAAKAERRALRLSRENAPGTA